MAVDLLAQKPSPNAPAYFRCPHVGWRPVAKYLEAITQRPETITQDWHEGHASAADALEIAAAIERAFASGAPEAHEKTVGWPFYASVLQEAADFMKTSGGFEISA